MSQSSTKMLEYVWVILWFRFVDRKDCIFGGTSTHFGSSGPSVIACLGIIINSTIITPKSACCKDVWLPLLGHVDKSILKYGCTDLPF